MSRVTETTPAPGAILDSLDGLIVDLDGVVYVGDRAIPGSPEAIAELRRRGKRLVFVTNDPVSSRAQYVEKLRSIGVAADPADIVTSASTLAALLQREASIRRVFVVGSPAFKDEIASADVQLLEGEAARQVDAVVLAGHPELSYVELRLATQAVLNGAKLYAAGRDATFPMPDGPWPATGAILAAVEFATGRTGLAVGKPERYIFDIARALMGDNVRLAVVGDRVDSDIEGGRQAGLFTILVLSGSTKVAPTSPEAQPDLVVADLRALLGR